MKKVITICLLVATLLLGGLTLDAKTTKRKGRLALPRQLPHNGMETYLQQR